MDPNQSLKCLNLITCLIYIQTHSHSYPMWDYWGVADSSGLGLTSSSVHSTFLSDVGLLVCRRLLLFRPDVLINPNTHAWRLRQSNPYSYPMWDYWSVADSSRLDLTSSSVHADSSCLDLTSSSIQTHTQQPKITKQAMWDLYPHSYSMWDYWGVANSSRLDLTSLLVQTHTAA